MDTPLPDELSLYVLSLLPYTEDLLTMMRVSSAWRRAALDHTLWRGRSVTVHQAAVLAQTRPNLLVDLGMLRVEAGIDFDTTLRRAAKRFADRWPASGLTGVSAVSVDSQPGVHLDRILASLASPALTHLALYDTDVCFGDTRLGGSLARLTNLRRISIANMDPSKTDRMHNERLLQLLFQLSMPLEHVTAHWWDGTVPHGETELLTDSGPACVTLRVLHLKNAQFYAYDEDMPLLGNDEFPSLEIVRFDQPSLTEQTLFRRLPPPRLQELSVWQARPLENTYPVLQRLHIVDGVRRAGLRGLITPCQIPTLAFLEVHSAYATYACYHEWCLSLLWELTSLQCIQVQLLRNNTGEHPTHGTIYRHSTNGRLIKLAITLDGIDRDEIIFRWKSHS